MTSESTTNKNKLDLDFNNTEIAFANKTDKELSKGAFVFKMMTKSWFVNISSKLAILGIKLKLPFVKAIVKSTIFPQFVGGDTLLNCQKNIDHLYEHKVLTVLDYGAEAKSTEKAFNQTMNEFIRAIEFAATNASCPVISIKLTGLGRFELYERVQQGEELTAALRAEYRNILKRLDSVCYVASEKQVGVFVDAEESWIQETIDRMVLLMMKRYNKERVIVYNTFQMYRSDRLQFLFDSFDLAKQSGYLLGAKLVRGAYMDKESRRSAEMGYPNPIHPSKQATDEAFNMGIQFCVDNYELIGSCNASHNAKSAMLQAQLIQEKGIPRDHPHLNFCQLYGMSDQLTFNLAHAGFNSSKYVPYGAVNEVIPYLIRRAQENTTVTGEVGRELKMFQTEITRRKRK